MRYATFLKNLNSDDLDINAFLKWMNKLPEKLPQFGPAAWKIFVDSKLTNQEYTGFLKTIELFSLFSAKTKPQPQK